MFGNGFQTIGKFDPYGLTFVHLSSKPGNHFLYLGMGSNRSMIQTHILPQIDLAQDNINKKRHTWGPLCSGNAIQGGPLYFDPMIQHIILPQIGLAHDKINNNATQVAHCVSGNAKRHTGGDHCVLIP